MSHIANPFYIFPFSFLHFKNCVTRSKSSLYSDTLQTTTAAGKQQLLSTRWRVVLERLIVAATGRWKKGGWKLKGWAGPHNDALASGLYCFSIIDGDVCDKWKVMKSFSILIGRRNERINTLGWNNMNKKTLHLPHAACNQLHSLWCQKKQTQKNYKEKSKRLEATKLEEQ